MFSLNLKLVRTVTLAAQLYISRSPSKEQRYTVSSLRHVPIAISHARTERGVSVVNYLVFLIALPTMKSYPLYHPVGILTQVSIGVLLAHFLVVGVS
jgi:hypothetical protein